MLPSTRSVHLLQEADSATRAIVPPIVQNTAFAFKDIDSWREVVSHREPGDTYGRNTNPTLRHFEKIMAAFEETETALSFSTGMAAISNTLFALLRPGMRAVTIKDAYGATSTLFKTLLPEFGISTVLCDTEDQNMIANEISKGCDLFFAETPTNPMLRIIDLDSIIRLVHSKGGLAVIDNTFATPINQKPVRFGADVVLHSATKYICGHGDVLGGVVCGEKELIDKIFRLRELTGATLDVHSASLLLRSMKTLGLRIERHNRNAFEIAKHLEGKPEVETVYYPGLESNPGYDIARKQMNGYGGVLSFNLKDGYEAVKSFLPRLRYAYLAPNLGQVETIAGTPSTTSHAELTDEERRELGIPEALVRYAVGIEDIDDMKLDIDQAFEAMKRSNDQKIVVQHEHAETV
ncbi:MAG: cystathionine gamma-synthase family protein [bacterium]|nr:cystathionine gamma-synthase family protein [bacterium]